MTLSVKQEKFCLEYAKTGNGVDSYKNAGYKVTTTSGANTGAFRLLAKPEIKARLAELHEEMASEKIANAAEIQERLTSILRGEEQEEVVVVEGIEKGVTEARIIKKKPSPSDMVRAGQTLARMQGALDNNVNVSITVPVFGGEDKLED